MPPPLLFDISKLDLNRVIIPIEGIRSVIPQRFEMEMLTGIVYEDLASELIVGFKDITPQDFWVRGHIPGRPLMPGVMMIESAAQLCAYWTMRRHPEMGFVGFAKCDHVRFRGTVIPPARIYMIAKTVEQSRRRCVAHCQGICNGTQVFEATVTGMSV